MSLSPGRVHTTTVPWAQEEEQPANSTSIYSNTSSIVWVPQLSGLGTLSLPVLVCVGKMCLLYAVFEVDGQDELMVRRGRIQGFSTPV